MQTDRKVKRKGLIGRWTILPALGTAAIVVAIAARATPPALTLTPLGNGDLQLSITNAIPTNTYDIYYTPNFNSGFAWNFFYRGAAGQTNFTISLSNSPPSGFFIVTDIDDFDGDGIPNWEDANPNNASIGIMTVIIDTPTNGYTFR